MAHFIFNSQVSKWLEFTKYNFMQLWIVSNCKKSAIVDSRIFLWIIRHFRNSLSSPIVSLRSPTPWKITSTKPNWSYMQALWLVKPTMPKSSLPWFYSFERHLPSLKLKTLSVPVTSMWTNCQLQFYFPKSEKYLSAACDPCNVSVLTWFKPH